MKAASFLGVPVWTLHEEVPIVWRNRALTAIRAEGDAHRQQKNWEQAKSDWASKN